MVYIFFFSFKVYFIVSLSAETNRSPFDFAKGESELVSGFNVEYAGGLFAFDFLAEYTNIEISAISWVNVYIYKGEIT